MVLPKNFLKFLRTNSFSQWNGWPVFLKRLVLRCRKEVQGVISTPSIRRYEMKGKPPKESVVEMVQQVLPGYANSVGTVFGGKVMEWIDIAAAVCSMRHTQEQVVTASFDRVDFFAPAHVGEVMVLTAKINFT